jgi:hypothetical protein
MDKLRGKIREADLLLRGDGRVNTEVDAAWDNTALREGMQAAMRAREAQALRDTAGPEPT